MSGDSSPGLKDLKIAAFESRRAEEMVRMIEREGGIAYVSPSLREVPLANNSEAVDFANRLITGQVDVMILMTGVGTRHLMTQVERHVGRERFLMALSDVVTVVRGPKPAAVFKEWGIKPTHLVPQPNTWREVLTTLDEKFSLANMVIGLQEYGETNPSLVAGLEARGASVINVKVYLWDLPEDCGPLQANVRRIVAGDIDIVLFTSARQIVSLLQVAVALNLAQSLRDAFQRLVVASIGPTTSAKLRNEALPVDVEPNHPKMGHLVRVAAAQGRRILEQKHRLFPMFQQVPNSPRKSLTKAPWDDSPFMKACRREPCQRTPIWLMRQAGRYMPEYRVIREKMSFMELCKNPQLASEVMVTAVDRLGVDAAIIFSDVLPILEPMGMDLEFSPDGGPVIHNPVRASTDVERVLELENVDALHFVTETVQQTRISLPENIPLIGFAGAPFTLASYVIEGGASRNFLHTKTLMYRDEGAFRALLDRFVRAVSLYLRAQITAGAQAVQLFDSWAGCLGPEDFGRYVQPHTRSLVESLPAGVPVIYFATGNPSLLSLMGDVGSSVIGVDWRVRLDDAWHTVGHDRAIQGNLDPVILLAPRNEICRRAEEILKQAAGRPGHIFNLGHGVLPQTPVENVIALVDAVHNLSSE